MDIKTINQVSENISLIKDKLDGIDWSQFPDQKFGNESEYTYKGLLGGLQSMLTDMSTLVNNPDVFVQKTTYQDRTTIRDQLSNCHSYLESPGNLYVYVDALKVALRPFQLRYSKLRAVEFSKEIDVLVRKGREVEALLEDIKVKKAEADALVESAGEDKDTIVEKLQEFESEYKSLLEKRADLDKEITKAKELSEQVEALHNTIAKKEEIITEIETGAKANEKIINSFSTKVQERDKRLEELETESEKYSEALKEFTKEREALLAEAAGLIDSAKKALNYKTAEGISAAFAQQYADANKVWALRGWIIGSVCFVIVALLLTAWIVSGKWISDPNSINSIVGRIVAVAISITGATFCAQQYVKQKNLAEDYAYKAVLSKSIIAFTEEIKTRDEQRVAEYLTKVLDEIHRDPLRSRNLREDKTDILSPILQKIEELAKKN